MRRLAPPLLLAAGAMVLAAPPAPAQEEGGVRRREVVGHVYEPRRLEPTDERVAGLRVPEGFKVGRFADGLKNPRVIAVADDGTVYVTRRDIGDVVMLRDADGDGRADEGPMVVAARPQMHGIAIRGRKAYLATVEDGTFSELERIIDDLPGGGQHPNRTLAVGPDGMLYITVGSTCNACDETDPENATVLRASPDGKRRRIFASGLRNTIGFDWHPRTGQLWAMDMGIDWLGDDDQPEELNRLEEGRKYGWPYIYADGKENPQDEPPGGVTAEQWRRTSEQPALTYTAHASPLQLVFYEGGQFPEAYRGDAFVTFRGSWNRRPPSGYEVARVRFGEDGQPTAFEPFMTGFVRELDGGRDHGFIGRPAGLAVAKDGSLLIADDLAQVVWRVSYRR
jgi:glucose/arabinose dehydrogenase